MSAIRISVGAAKDRSVDEVLGQVVSAARRARTQIANEAAKASATETKAAKESATEQIRLAKEIERIKDKQFKALEKQASQWQREQAKAEREATRESEKQAKAQQTAYEKYIRAVLSADAQRAREHAKNEREMAAESERQTNRAMKAQAKAQRDGDRQHASAMASGGRIARGVGSMGYSAARSAVGVGLDFAQSMGVETDIWKHVSNATDLESRASDLSNAGFMPGDKRNGTRVSSERLQEEALNIAKRRGGSASTAMEGLQGFVAKTGDLATGRGILDDMAKLSKATGASLADMADAAGDVANELGDVPNKAERINGIMHAIAGQGKLGAVEIKDLASQMAKIGAAAGQFEGDAGENMITFGAIAQEARAKGGAASATQAATSLGSLTNTFSKGARLDAFKAAGVRTTGAGGKVRNIEEIIVESLQKTQHGTNADTTNRAFGSLFADAKARTAVRGFEQTFRSTYGETQGTEDEKLAAATRAVKEEFDHLKNATLDQTLENEAFTEAMKTSKSQAEIANAQLDELGKNVKDAVIPAFLALAPMLTDIVGSVAKLTGGENEHNNRNEEAGNITSAYMTANTALNSGTITPQQKKDFEDAYDAALKDANRAEIATKETGVDKWKRVGLKVLSTGVLGGMANDALNQDNASHERAVADSERANENLRLMTEMHNKIAAAVAQEKLQVILVEDRTTKPKPPHPPPGAPPPMRNQL